VNRAWALALANRFEEALVSVESATQFFAAIGCEMTLTFRLGARGAALAGLGRNAEALQAFDDALEVATRNEERYMEPEIWRLKGELLREDCSDEAERCYQSAIDVARQQEAKSWELRSATSYARFLRDRGDKRGAQAVLTAIYQWFNEGFDTQDLRDAKALLDEN
jgi:predicted RNA polymerase sigma factor